MFLRLLGVFLIAITTTLFSLFSGISGCAGPSGSDDDTEETGDGALILFPANCEEVQDQAIEEEGTLPTDGTYTLYIDNDESMPWNAYCRNMSRSTPLEYLTVTEEDNFSQIASDEAVAESTYRRYRIDPTTLEIDPLDATFATTDFSSFEPTLPSEDMEDIPAGWAEVQSTMFNLGATARASVSLEGTAFEFADAVLALDESDVSTFFCQVDSEEQLDVSTNGTGFEADSLTFQLTAINLNSEEMPSVSTRMVADCDNLGTGATDFSTAAWPLVYVGE